MSEMTLQDAAQALSDSYRPEATPAPETSQPAVTPEVDAGITPPAAPVEDSFTDIDPSQFTDADEYKKRLQADYTRKTQALAEQRSAYDGIDPETARQSVEFIRALESDPDFVVEVHQQLTEALKAAGLTPAEAAEAASDAIGDYTADDESLGADSPLAQEIAELKQWKENQEALQYEHQLASQLQREENALRQANPTWTDDDFDSVYELAFAHGGSLQAASNSYKALQNRIASSYIDRKASVSDNGAPLSTSGHSVVPPEGFGSDVEAAHKAAQEHLRHLLAND